MTETNRRYVWRRLIVRDPHLTDASRRVLLELESYADRNGTNARPGIHRLAQSLLTATGHISERTVRRALETGIERGFIECVQKGHGGRGNNASDVYKLIPPEGVSLDTQMSTEAEVSVDTQTTTETQNTGHPDVHRTSMAIGHPDVHWTPPPPDTQMSTEAPTGGHPDVHLPERDISTYVSSKAAVSKTRDDENLSRRVPGDGWALVREVIPNGHSHTIKVELAMQSSALLNQGTPRDDVKATLERWLIRPGTSPRILPNLLSDVLRARDSNPASTYGVRPDSGSRQDAKVAGYLAFANNRPNNQRELT